jgi:ribonuclease HI
MSRDVGPGQELLFGAPERVASEPVATPRASTLATVVVATDGSCLSNPGPGGWCWFVDDGCWAAGGEPDTTNNRMELLAVLEAVTSVPRDHPLLVRADSSYTIDACTKWIHGWKRRGWKTAQGAAVKNREIIEAIDLELASRTVTFEWVKGHAGHLLNEAADLRCRAAAESVQRARGVATGPGWADRE